MDANLERIERRVRAHWKRMDANRWLWQRMRMVADNRMWERGTPQAWDAMLRAPEKLPVKVQVNLLRPWLAKQVAAMYLRAPRCTASPPLVRASSARGSVSPHTVKAVRSVCEQWLVNANVKQVVEQAMETALLYPGAALKIGWDRDMEGADPLDRVWIQVVDRWEAMWEERADCLDRSRYLGHIRWIPIEEAEGLNDGPLPDMVKPQVIPDYLDTGTMVSTTDEDLWDDGYVQVLDWHDVGRKTWRQLLVNQGDGPMLHPLGEEMPEPYTLPNGRPLYTLRPLVLANSIGHPLQPVALAVPIYEQSCEKSLILSFVVNAFRRDSSRVVLYLKERGLTPDQVTAITNAVDLEFVGIEPEQQGNIANIFAPLALPDISSTLREAYQWMSQAGSESSPLSAIGQGGTGGLQYAAATLVQSLSTSDAAVMTAPGGRMSQILGDLCEGLLTILAEEVGGLRVMMGGEACTISKEQLKLRWEIKVDDGLAQEGMAQGRRAELLQVLPAYVTAVASATTKPPPPQPGQPPVPDIPGEVRVANERIVDLICDTWMLPDWMRFEALEQAQEEETREEEDEVEDMVPPPIPTPEELGMAAPGPGAPAGAEMSDEELAAALAQLPPDQLQAAAAAMNREV